MSERTILPDCMLPDGADPCAGYQQLYAQVESLRSRLASLEEQYERRGYCLDTVTLDCRALKEQLAAAEAARKWLTDLHTQVSERLAAAERKTVAQSNDMVRLRSQLGAADALLRRYRDEPKHHDCLPCPGNCDLCGLHMEADDHLARKP